MPAWLAKAGPLVALAAVWGLFALLGGGDFSSWSNQRLMLLQTAVVGAAAIGATLIIVAGGIDLSVGSTIALGTMTIAWTLRAGGGEWLAIAVGGLTALLCGAGIGALVIGQVGRVLAVLGAALIVYWCWTPLGGALAVVCGIGALAALLAAAHFGLRQRLALSPFIVTLGMWGALRGLAKGIGDNQPIYPNESWLPKLMESGTSGPTALLAPGVWLTLGLAVLAASVLRYTRFGRHLFAIGSNELTARLCGVRVERTKLLIYVLGVGCAGLASVLQFAYLSMGDPTTAGGYELKVIAAVVIGGASLSGGEGSILGTLVGALLMTVVDNGCTKLGLDNWVQEIVTGAIIVGAVLVDQLRHKRDA